jgi:hypothetical protein
MTSARKSEIAGFLRTAYIEADPQVRQVLFEMLEEIKPKDDTRPRKCIICGRISYFDPITQRHRCKFCAT